jgi:hypothetical protein
MHDKPSSDFRKAEVLKARLEETPVNIIKGFLQVKLESNIAFLPLGSPHEMDDFL